MPKTEITNMVMVQHPETGMCLCRTGLKAGRASLFQAAMLNRANRFMTAPCGKSEKRPG